MAESLRDIDFDEDDYADVYDGEDDATADCLMYLEGGVLVCGAFGSEQCDWECPMSCDIGLTPKEAEARAVEETMRAIRAEREAKGNAEYESWGAAIDSRTEAK